MGIEQTRRIEVDKSGKDINGSITSHVFLTFENNKSVSAMGLLFLVGLFVGVCVGNDTNLKWNY